MSREKGLPPIYTEESKVLILGTFPAKESRESGVYYANPNNKFWETICDYDLKSGGYHISHLPRPILPALHSDSGVQAKLLGNCGIAVWDMIDECDIQGSSNKSIKNPKFNDIQGLLDKTEIELILLSGKDALEMYEKHFKGLPVHHIGLPSTSPANPSFDKDTWFNAMKIVSDEYHVIAKDIIDGIDHYIEQMKLIPDSDEDVEKGLADYLNKDILVEAVIAQIKRGK